MTDLSNLHIKRKVRTSRDDLTLIAIFTGSSTRRACRRVASRLCGAVYFEKVRKEEEQGQFSVISTKRARVHVFGEALGSTLGGWRAEQRDVAADLRCERGKRTRRRAEGRDDRRNDATTTARRTTISERSRRGGSDENELRCLSSVMTETRKPSCSFETDGDVVRDGMLLCFRFFFPISVEIVPDSLIAFSSLMKSCYSSRSFLQVLISVCKQRQYNSNSRSNSNIII